MAHGRHLVQTAEGCRAAARGQHEISRIVRRGEFFFYGVVRDRRAWEARKSSSGQIVGREEGGASAGRGKGLAIRSGDEGRNDGSCSLYRYCDHGPVTYSDTEDRL